VSESEVYEDASLGLSVLALHNILVLSVYVPKEGLTKVVIVRVIVDSEAFPLIELLLLTLGYNLQNED
jgi:hypothetical protein